MSFVTRENPAFSWKVSDKAAEMATVHPPDFYWKWKSPNGG
jgi:hypothetical protein